MYFKYVFQLLVFQLLHNTVHNNMTPDDSIRRSVSKFFYVFYVTSAGRVKWMEFNEDGKALLFGLIRDHNSHRGQ